MKWRETPRFQQEISARDQRHIKFLWPAHPSLTDTSSDTASQVKIKWSLAGHVLRTGALIWPKSFRISRHWSLQPLSHQRWSCMCAYSSSTLSNPVDRSPPSSSVHGILQARILEWAAVSCSRGSSRPRDWTHISCVSCISRQILYHQATWEAPEMVMPRANPCPQDWYPPDSYLINPSHNA